MLKPNQKFKVSILELMNPHSRKHYESIGFNYEELKSTYKTLKERKNNFVFLDETLIKINHNTELIYICDYCNTEFISNGSRHRRYLSPEGLDRCKKCAVQQGKIAYKDTCLQQYGTDHFTKTEEGRTQLITRWKNMSESEYASLINKRIETIQNRTEEEKQIIEDKTANTNIKRFGTKAPAQNKCILQKMQDTCVDRYGVENISQTQQWKNQVKDVWENKTQEELDDIKTRSKYTYMENTGYLHPMKNPEVQQKFKETCIERYGVSNPSQCQDVRDRVKATNLERFGNEEFLASGYSIEKRTQTLIDTYGVDHPMKIPSISDKAIKNALSSKYQNGTAPSSKQQRYLCDVYNGELNFYIENSRVVVDIAFPNEKTCIEYDGSGHNLDVVCGNKTIEEKQQSEKKRNYFLLNNDWKIIRIISNKDLLPSDDILLNMLDYSKRWILNTHSWITFNIDDLTVTTSIGIQKYDFGLLRKIK